MTSHERDYDDILRRALRAAAESVEPAADGLDRIRGRVSAPRVSFFVSLTEFLDWFRPILLRLEAGAAGARSGLQALASRMELPARSAEVLDRVRPALARMRALVSWVQPLFAAVGWKAVQRPRAAHRTQPQPAGLRALLRPAFTRLGPAASWLRPVLAVAGAVAIVVAGVFALGQAQQFITPTNQISHPGVTQHGSSGAATTPAGVVPPIPIWVNQSATPTSAANSSPGARIVTSCPPASPKASATSTAPKSTPTPTPTPSVTPTPTPTVSVTPTPTPTGTGVPSSGGIHLGEVAVLRAKELPVPCSSATRAA